MDWNKKWEEYISEEFFCAVLCTKCNMTASVCNCAKELWINEQKYLNGDKTIKIPYICYYCKEKMFHGLCQSVNNQIVDICEKCCKLN